jgi:hypothetical protein
LLLLLLAGIARSTALLILTRALRLVTLLLLIALLLAILLSGFILVAIHEHSFAGPLWLRRINANIGNLFPVSAADKG